MTAGIHHRIQSALAVLVIAWAAAALAAGHAHGGPGGGPGAPGKRGAHAPAGPRWQGDIARFHERDWGVWRGGRWAHERHDGRLGWWWVVGGLWYFYPAPVYPYPNPWEPTAPLAVSPAPPVPATQYWYYCEASATYYPYVADCPAGWKQVPATPPASVSVPQK